MIYQIISVYKEHSRLTTMTILQIFLRLTYETTVQLFGHSIVPLRLKLWITHGLQNLGGIHAGCGTASIVWSIYAVVELFVHRATVPTPPIAILFVVIFMLLISCLAAVSVLRLVIIYLAVIPYHFIGTHPSEYS